MTEHTGLFSIFETRVGVNLVGNSKIWKMIYTPPASTVDSFDGQGRYGRNTGGTIPLRALAGALLKVYSSQHIPCITTLN